MQHRVAGESDELLPQIAHLVTQIADGGLGHRFSGREIVNHGAELHYAGANHGDLGQCFLHRRQAAHRCLDAGERLRKIRGLHRSTSLLIPIVTGSIRLTGLEFDTSSTKQFGAEESRGRERVWTTSSGSTYSTRQKQVQHDA